MCMAQINSYTGEVRSAPTTIEQTDNGFTIPVESAVLDALDMDPGEKVVLKGKVGGAEITVEPVTARDEETDA